MSPFRISKKTYNRDLTMNILEAVLLGILQGITEFLPVSSSAHLTLVQQLMKIQYDQILFFDLSLHLGTLAAVVFLFRKDLVKLSLSLSGIVRDLLYNAFLRLHHSKTPEDIRYRKVLSTNYRRLAFSLLVTSLPTAVLGYLMHDIAELAFGSLFIPGVLLFITAVMLLVADLTPRGEKTPKTMKPVDALIAGIIQGFSVLPGLSRFGTGLSACLLAGLSRKFAVKYSVLMSVPAILGGMILELTRAGCRPPASGIGVCLAGAIVSGLTGCLAIRFMLRIVRNIKLRVFALYCAILGVLFIAVHFAL